MGGKVAERYAHYCLGAFAQPAFSDDKAAQGCVGYPTGTLRKVPEPHLASIKQQGTLISGGGN